MERFVLAAASAAAFRRPEAHPAELAGALRRAHRRALQAAGLLAVVLRQLPVQLIDLRLAAGIRVMRTYAKLTRWIAAV